MFIEKFKFSRILSHFESFAKQKTKIKQSNARIDIGETKCITCEFAMSFDVKRARYQVSYERNAEKSSENANKNDEKSFYK